MKSKTALRNFLFLAGSSLLALSSAHAALFFDGTPATPDGASSGGTGVWDATTANWDNGTGYVTWNNGDDAVIAGPANISVNSPVTVNTLTTVGYKKSYTVSGSEITINSGMSLVDLTGFNWSAPIKLGGDNTWVHDQVSNSTGKTMSGLTNLNGNTLTWDTNSVKANNSVNQTGGITGSGNIVKEGTGWARIAGTLDYSGTTTVNEGTLLVNGVVSNSAFTVNGGSIGGTGSIAQGLTIAAGGNLDLVGATLGLNSSGILSLTGGSLTLGDLTFEDLVGWDWMAADEGTYELIDGAFSVDFGSTAYLDESTAYDFGNGKGGYFTSGSLNAVIFAIPEPRTGLLCILGLLFLLRRKR